MIKSQIHHRVIVESLLAVISEKHAEQKSTLHVLVSSGKERQGNIRVFPPRSFSSTIPAADVCPRSYYAASVVFDMNTLFEFFRTILDTTIKHLS